VKLSDHWASGMRTKHGIHVHGFPNAFFVQPTQGANLISNVPHNLTEAARTIALMVQHALANGFKEIEVTREAEDRWVELLLTGAGRMIGSPDCTPATTTMKGATRSGGQAQCRPSGGPDGLLQIYRGLAQQRPVRGTAVPLTSFPIFCLRKGVHNNEPTRHDGNAWVPASAIAQHAATLKALPFRYGDFDISAWFSAPSKCAITSPRWTVWSGPLAEQAPPTVDPSSAASRLNTHAFDCRRQVARPLANMTNRATAASSW
jgi:hypothetical protein